MPILRPSIFQNHAGVRSLKRNSFKEWDDYICKFYPDQCANDEWSGPIFSNCCLWIPGKREAIHTLIDDSPHQFHEFNRSSWTGIQQSPVHLRREVGVVNHLRNVDELVGGVVPGQVVFQLLDLLKKPQPRAAVFSEVGVSFSAKLGTKMLGHGEVKITTSDMRVTHATQHLNSNNYKKNELSRDFTRFIQGHVGPESPSLPSSRSMHRKLEHTSSQRRGTRRFRTSWVQQLPAGSSGRGSTPGQLRSSRSTAAWRSNRRWSSPEALHVSGHSWSRWVPVKAIHKTLSKQTMKTGQKNRWMTLDIHSFAKNSKISFTGRPQYVRPQL